MPFGYFATYPYAIFNSRMQTVYETRRIRLGMLKTKHKSWAALNEAMGWDRTSARLSQIHSQTPRRDRGTTYTMGDSTARDIETALKLELGWMDTPPTYAELYGEQDPRAIVLTLMESLPPEEWPTAVRLLSALKEPAGKNGTTG